MPGLGRKRQLEISEDHPGDSDGSIVAVVTTSGHSAKQVFWGLLTSLRGFNETRRGGFVWPSPLFVYYVPRCIRHLKMLRQELVDAL